MQPNNQPPKSPHNRGIAVVTPIYKGTLSTEEQQSIAAIKSHLSKLDCFLVHPEQLHIQWNTDGFSHIPIHQSHFDSIRSYSAMCLNPCFYQHFSAYTYILICQTDAIVFRANLETWCQHGYSYIGAPWTKRRFSILRNSLSKRIFKRNLRHSSRHHQLGPVGNGGLSLRKVSDCMATLNQPVHMGQLLKHSRWLLKHWSVANVCLMFKLYLNHQPTTIGKLLQLIASHPKAHRTRGEDVLFHILSHWHPSFTMPAPTLAARFATENMVLHGLLPDEIPFGAHGKHFFENTPESRAFYQRYQPPAPYEEDAHAA